MEIKINNTQKQKILIVDDSEMNRSILADMLENEYEIIEAEDGEIAIAKLQKHLLEISVVLLDVVMPRVDGFEVLSVMNQKHWIEDIPVIMISAENDSSKVERAYELGVTDFITRPFDTLIVRRRVVNTILLYAKQKKLVGMLADQIYEKERLSSLMVDILSHIVEFRNGESGLHIIRVRTLTKIFLQQLQRKTDRYHLSQEDISLISTASALHDIGKIAVNEDILNKPGRLTAEEFEQIKKHSEMGAEMLKNLPAYKTEPLVRTAYEICRWHHERYDGKGYPDGLVGEDIPISAQIVALSDVYDALTSDRCYKKAYSHETSVQMILEGQCGTFNPLLLECLKEVAPTLRAELESAAARQYRPEIQETFLKISSDKDMMVSERSLRLLDHERMKYNFFAEMSEEIQFEYTLTPPMVSLSSWGAKKLGVSEVIMDPKNNKEVLSLMGEETWCKLSELLRATVPEHPIITHECLFNFDGQPRWYKIIAQAIWSAGEPSSYMGAIGKCMDIHDSHVRLDDLEYKANHDMPTGLLNRTKAKEIIQARMDEEPEGDYIMGIFDLDNFKSANDTYGHQFGDRVLRHVADKLRQSTCGDDIVARAGGDEFLVFHECNTDAEEVIKNIFDGITGYYKDFQISLTLGVARSKIAGCNYDKLFRAADKALYSAKRAGRRQYRFYSECMKEMLSAISPIDSDTKGDNDK